MKILAAYSVGSLLPRENKAGLSLNTTRDVHETIRQAPVARAYSDNRSDKAMDNYLYAKELGEEDKVLKYFSVDLYV